MAMMVIPGGGKRQPPAPHKGADKPKSAADGLGAGVLLSADDLRTKARTKARFWEQTVPDDEHVALDQVLTGARNEILLEKERSRRNMGMREKERQRREQERQERGRDNVKEEMKKQQAIAGLRTLQQFLSESTLTQNAEEEREKALKLAKSLKFSDFGSMRDFCNALHRANLNLQSQQAIFKFITQYISSKALENYMRNVNENVKVEDLEDWHDEANRDLSRLKDEITRFCITHMSDPGPVGESPVHLAFLFQEHELGKRMITTSARFLAFNDIFREARFTADPPRNMADTGKRRQFSATNLDVAAKRLLEDKDGPKEKRSQGVPVRLWLLESDVCAHDFGRDHEDSRSSRVPCPKCGLVQCAECLKERRGSSVTIVCKDCCTECGGCSRKSCVEKRLRQVAPAQQVELKIQVGFGGVLEETGVVSVVHNSPETFDEVAWTTVMGIQKLSGSTGICFAAAAEVLTSATRAAKAASDNCGAVPAADSPQKTAAKVDLLENCHEQGDGFSDLPNDVIDLFFKQPVAFHGKTRRLWIRRMQIDGRLTDTSVGQHEDGDMWAHFRNGKLSPTMWQPAWADWYFWKGILNVKKVRTAYIRHMAEIINAPYTSDLAPWIAPKARENDVSAYLDDLLATHDVLGSKWQKVEEKVKERLTKKGSPLKLPPQLEKALIRGNVEFTKKELDSFGFTEFKKDDYVIVGGACFVPVSEPMEGKDVHHLKWLLDEGRRREAHCTLGYCANNNPWSIRGTLHPWRRRADDPGQFEYEDCEYCRGGNGPGGSTGGKDGGLFSGETALHIVIVQHNLDMVDWLLKRGAHLDNRALGVFFQGAQVRGFSGDAGIGKENNIYFSECSYGEYPLSFASAVGNEHVCHLLLEAFRARVRLMFNLIGAHKVNQERLKTVSKNRLHTAARSQSNTDYPERFYVPDRYVDWSVEWVGYKPTEFNHHSIRGVSWADPEEKAHMMEFSVERFPSGQPGGTYKTAHGDRVTFEELIYVGKGPVEPQNPRGRTGIQGRGLLGKWGPNLAVDAIVTRYHPNGGQLQVVVIQRVDAQRETWALPGGIVEAKEGVDSAFRRVIARRLQKGHEEYDSSLAHMFPSDNDDMWSDWSDVFKGYVDDPRNTDNAWFETTVKHFHCNEKLGQKLPLAEGVIWLDINPKIPQYDDLYGSHKLWVDAVHECMGQNSAARASTLRMVTGDWDVCITEQEREDFKNDMLEWMNAKEEQGGGGERYDVEAYFDLLQSAFVNRSDAHGNTALHQAVLHQSMEALDFLLENGATPSLSFLNGDNLTPLTLAARKGDCAMLKHLISKGSTHIWSYGSVGMTITSLEMVDTFRLTGGNNGGGVRAKNPLTRLSLKVDVSPSQELSSSMWTTIFGGFGSQSKRLRVHAVPVASHNPSRRDALNRGYQLLPHVVRLAGRAEYDHVHQDPDYRSALEVVVTHEIDAYHFGSEEVWGDKIFETLIEEKWENFGKRYHIWNELVPYALVVLVFMLALFTRTSSVYEGIAGRSPWYCWMDPTLPLHFPFTPQDAQRVICPVFYAMVIPTLIFLAIRDGRFKQTDYDPNEDLSTDFTEFLFFVFKNLGPMMNLLIALFLIALLILWLQAPDAAGFSDSFATELSLLSITCLLFWCRLLHLFLPFQSVGRVLITIWRMILSDVGTWLVVFVLLLIGFGTATYTLLLQKRMSEGQSVDGSVEEPVGYAEFVILYLYVSLGEVSGTGEMDQIWMMVLHIAFVITATLLMLNLIIAMMGDTYSEEASKAGFVMWWMNHAHDVLKYERRLSAKKRHRHRSGADFTPEVMYPERRPFFRIKVARQHQNHESLHDVAAENHQLHKEIVQLRREHEVEEQMNKLMFRRLDAKLNALFTQNKRQMSMAEGGTQERGSGEWRKVATLIRGGHIQDGNVIGGHPQPSGYDAKEGGIVAGSPAGGVSGAAGGRAPLPAASPASGGAITGPPVPAQRPTVVSAGAGGGGGSSGARGVVAARAGRDAGNAAPRYQPPGCGTPTRAVAAVAARPASGPATPKDTSSIILDVGGGGNGGGHGAAQVVGGVGMSMPDNFVAELFQTFDTGQTGAISREHTCAIVLEVLARVGAVEAGPEALQSVITALVAGCHDEIVTVRELAHSLQLWIPRWRTGGLEGLEACLPARAADAASAVPASAPASLLQPKQQQAAAAAGCEGAVRGTASRRFLGSDSQASTPGSVRSGVTRDQLRPLPLPSSQLPAPRAPSSARPRNRALFVAPPAQRDGQGWWSAAAGRAQH